MHLLKGEITSLFQSHLPLLNSLSCSNKSFFFGNAANLVHIIIPEYHFNSHSQFAPEKERASSFHDRSSGIFLSIKLSGFTLRSSCDIFCGIVVAKIYDSQFNCFAYFQWRQPMKTICCLEYETKIWSWSRLSYLNLRNLIGCNLDLSLIYKYLISQAIEYSEATEIYFAESPFVFRFQQRFYQF